MKRLIYIILASFVIVILGATVLANEENEAINFFKKYIVAANSYSPEILTFYSPDAKIIRQVLKPDGTSVDMNTDTETYIKQLKLGQRMAKLRKYKNTYTNIKSEKVPNGYKISSLRQPSGEKYKLKTYMIVRKQPDGKWLIVEEFMQTKVQTFLKYAKN